MNEIENIVKNVVYGGIGAAAAIVEKGGQLARTLVEKGQETVHANQDTVDQLKETAADLKRRIQEFCEKFMNNNVPDASGLTREQRDELRRELDAQDALDAEAEAACRCDEPAEIVPDVVITPEGVLSDDDVPVFEPDGPTYTAPDEK